ncbi:hypothetical protein B9G53_17055 [Pseudanabaena sp. SR411]|uniref:pentapeptide repeat-containing protein n=1 Tax=Pseudanabaena sp. SR411 TaxID=1980935 RepID=UPI000B999460|nr:pentapeptide repeat-containing protein [Pseudanabaena sp. SR411]OYQ63432.1 hypothetical protein B9G53_17055 [Pseudanabaena sp. SR411]
MIILWQIGIAILGVVTTFVIPASAAVRFEQADLERLQRTKNCVNCQLRGADLSGMDLSGANLSGSQLFEVNLERANLTKANLSYTQMRRVKLQGANITETNFIGAGLGGTDFRGLNLEIAYFEGAMFCHALMPNGSQNVRDCRRFRILGWTKKFDSPPCPSSAISRNSKTPQSNPDDLNKLYLQLVGALSLLNAYRNDFTAYPFENREFISLFPAAYYNTTKIELAAILRGDINHPQEKMEQMIAFFDAFQVNWQRWHSGRKDQVEPHWSTQFDFSERMTKSFQACLETQKIDPTRNYGCYENYLTSSQRVLQAGIDAHVNNDMARSIAYTLERFKSRGIAFSLLKEEFDDTVVTLKKSSQVTLKEVISNNFDRNILNWLDKALIGTLDGVLKDRQRAWQLGEQKALGEIKQIPPHPIRYDFEILGLNNVAQRNIEFLEQKQPIGNHSRLRTLGEQFCGRTVANPE